MNSQVGPNVVFVDHSGLPGGGQLGLKRYLLKSRLSRKAALFFSEGPVADELRKSGIKTYNLKASPKTWAYFLKGRQLRQTLEGIDPDLVVVNSTKGATLLALIRKSPTQKWIYYLRDDLNPARLSKLRLFYLSRLVLPRFDGFLANSQWTASTVPQALREKRPLRIAYPVSGDAEANTVASMARSEPTRLRLISLSRIARWKGIHVLVDALGILAERGLGSSVSTTIAGSSHFEDESFATDLRLRAEQIDTPIEFVGHVQDIDSYLGQSDVLLSCSITPEPFGQVLIQGLSRGLVVIGTNHGGPVEIIDSGRSGLLVEPDSPEALADALESLIRDPSLAERLSRQGAEAAQKFADTATVNQLDDALLDFWRMWNEPKEIM